LKKVMPGEYEKKRKWTGEEKKGKKKKKTTEWTF